MSTVTSRWLCLECVFLLLTFGCGVAFLATRDVLWFFLGMFVSSTHGAVRLWSSHESQSVCARIGMVRLLLCLLLLIPSLSYVSVQGEADAAVVWTAAFAYCLACLLPEAFLMAGRQA